MHPWITEDWEFTLTVLHGCAKDCRIGLEAGDRFTFRYALPAGMCPKTASHLHTLCEIIRCGGDFTHRGSADPLSIVFSCAEGVLTFRLTAQHLSDREDLRHA